jgi:DNA-binding response OmpR family regulator
MKEFLIHAHYNVMDYSTSDEAYEYLKKGRTDLILCDISLETSTMNGFLFYERIRELRHLHQVPFVFITGLNDAVLIRAGKEMGVDDFLVKPIHHDILLATIRGKIKRYEQMKPLAGL